MPPANKPIAAAVKAGGGDTVAARWTPPAPNIMRSRPSRWPTRWQHPCRSWVDEAAHAVVSSRDAGRRARRIADRMERL